MDYGCRRGEQVAEACFVGSVDASGKPEAPTVGT